MGYFYDGTQCVRYLDKTQSEDSIILYTQWWQEQIEQYGTNIYYFVNNFSLSAADDTYGEDTPSRFSDPQELIVVADLTQSQMFARWALMSDDFTTILIHISAFRNVFGESSEPKSGDVFQLIEFGSDRPGGRDGKKFEVTERLDEEITQINPLMGHYVWLVKAKRYEYSFEPGLSAEAQTNQVYDNTFFGRLSGYENEASTTKTYPGSASDDHSRTIIDYNDNDAVYGEYT